MNDTLFPDEIEEHLDLPSTDTNSLKHVGWLRSLMEVDGIGRVTTLRLIEKYQSIDALKKDVEKSQESIVVKFASQLKNLRFKETPVDADYRIIGFFDSGYPQSLKDLIDAPLVIWVKGAISSDNSITVVGTRNPTPIGTHLANLAGRLAAEIGVTTVSGLAIGIDTAVHEGSLAGTGKTIAVLGSGLDVVTPHKNRGLASRILENAGGLISEVDFGTEPSARTLVARNRIQAALGSRLLMVECGVPSGTLHTVRFAFQLNRRIGVPDLEGVNRVDNNLGNFLLSSHSADISDVLHLSDKDVLKLQGRKPFADVIIKNEIDLKNFVTG